MDSALFLKIMSGYVADDKFKSRFLNMLIDDCVTIFNNDQKQTIDIIKILPNEYHALCYVDNVKVNSFNFYLNEINWPCFSFSSANVSGLPR